MYLSRVSLNLSHLSAISFASSPYRIHAAVEGAFSPDAKRTGKEGRVLWRLDDVPNNVNEVWLYVQSPERPDLSRICNQAGGSASSWVTKDYDPVLNGVAAGQLWQFRLKANPVRKVFVDKGRSPREGVVGSIQGHVTEAQQRDWLLSRAEAHGFRIAQTEQGFDRLVVSHRGRERFNRQGRPVTLTTARYDGVLVVTDVKAFRHTLGFGMGRARGFGCGLMTIAPAREPNNAG